MKKQRFRSMKIRCIAAIGFMTLALVICSCKNTGEEGKQMDDYDKTTGYGNEEIRIRLPSVKTEVDAASFGLKENSIDNSFALLSAFVYCTLNPDTKLNIPKGVYRFDSADPIVMKGAKNILVEGNGSEFVFADIGYPLFTDCDSVLVRNLTIDWDWDFQRLASVAEVTDVARDHRYIDFTFPEIDNVSTDMQWMTMNQMDPQSLTPGVERGKEYWAASLQFDSVEKIGANQLRVYQSGSLNALKAGEIYLVRHQTYGGNVFTMKNCSNMSFKDITIYSGLGMGFLINDGTSHYQIRNCKVMLKPDSNRHITLTADGIHGVDTGGYAWIEGCDLSFMGDDAININDSISTVLSVNGGSSCTVSTIMFFKTGDTVKFRTADFRDIGFEAVITGITPADAKSGVLEFDRELPSEIGGGAILNNKKYDSSHYAIRDNYFHENRARGMLLRTGFGLVENNRLYKTQGAAILIQVDVAPLWAEGTGLANLLVQNNIFDTCNVNDWSALIDFSVNIPGGSPAQPIFSNITFKRNQFINFPSRSFVITAADNIMIEENSFVNDAPRMKESVLRETIWIERSKAVSILNNTFAKSEYVANPLQITVAEGNREDILVEQGNTIVD